MSKITLFEILETIGLNPEKIYKNILIKRINTLSEAVEGDLTFITNEKFINQANETRASAIIAYKGLNIQSKCPIIFVDNVWKELLKIYDILHKPKQYEPHIHPTAIIDRSTRLGKDVFIGPYVEIRENSIIGDNTVIDKGCFIDYDVYVGSKCLIYPNVTIMKGTRIGNNVIIHPGAVIGADGFRYEVIDGEIRKIPQIGNVIIEDNVEIGANTTIDRAGLNETRIGAGTKIDNLVQIAHNVRIGKNVRIAGQTGIAGSVEVGDNCVFGGMVGVKDNLKIGNNVQIAGMTGIAKNTPDNEVIAGFKVGLPFKKFMELEYAYSKLPEMRKEFLELKKKIESLTNNK